VFVGRVKRGEGGEIPSERKRKKKTFPREESPEKPKKGSIN